MKKWVIVLALSVLCSMSACGNADGDEEKMQVDANNRTIIAEAVGIEENDRKMHFILSTLNTISAGQIQSAEAAEEDGEKVINIVVEDGTNYCIYLSGSGSVEAVKNLDTGEWPVKSER